jgi:Ca2+-binding RTX toxin-like protein
MATGQQAAVAQEPTCYGETATITGTADGERLVGTERKDVIVARGGDDVVLGGDGNDLICAGRGRDIVRGNNGGDRLDGGRGHDLVSGAIGSDTLNGGSGRDQQRGGKGRDSFAHEADDEVDSLDGGSGNDVLFFNHAKAAVTVDLQRGFAQVADRRDRLALGTFETIYGSSDFADRIFGDDESNILFSGFGGPAGGGSTDLLKGRGGNDYLEGYETDDVLRGGSGDDVLFGGFGWDEVYGGAGIDLVRFCGHFSSSGTCGFSGAHPGRRGVTVDLTTGTVEGGGSLSGIENVEGTAEEDSITGADGGNHIYGGPRDDSLMGLGGDDLLVGDERAPLPVPLDQRIGNDLGGPDDPDGDDQLDGGDGDDQLRGDGGSDTCSNGESNEACEG